MSDDNFFERLRADAGALRWQPDDVAVTRMSARIRARVAAPPTVAQLIAAWFRPLSAGLAALALAATLGIAMIDLNGTDETFTEPVEISMAGDSYRVGE